MTRCWHDFYMVPSFCASSGIVYSLVPAYPGCAKKEAVKIMFISSNNILSSERQTARVSPLMSKCTTVVSDPEAEHWLWLHGYVVWNWSILQFYTKQSPNYKFSVFTSQASCSPSCYASVTRLCCTLHVATSNRQQYVLKTTTFH